MNKKSNTLVGVIMGSKSDWAGTMEHCSNTLKEFGINSYADRKNIGIWVNTKDGEKKIAAIGIKIKKWITFHGFSININNDLNYYKKIIPCGIKNKGVTNLNEIKKQNYKRIKNIIIKNLILNFKI